MPRYRSTFQLDDPFVEDGDAGFLGINEETESTQLPQGFVQLGENVRIENGKIYSRKGLKLDSGISGAKCIIPFRNPNADEAQLLIVSNDTVVGIGATTGITETIQFPFDSTDEVMGIQAFDKVILFSEGDRPKVWDGTTGSGFSDLATVPSINDGTFITCPSAPFGTHINNRLIVPNYADSSTSVVCSDIFNENLFQLATGEFFLNRGTADKTLGLGVMQESQLIVFNEKSIHIVNNIHTLDSSTSEVTRQYGIAGHRAFAQNGAYNYFISNEGDIQVLVPSSDPAKGMGIAISKLTLDSNPLSKTISKTVKRINRSAIKKSIVHYHRNKVFFCVPIDGSFELNAIIVYDSLNSQFISLDTLPINILDMNSLGEKLYILSDSALFEYEESDTDNSTPINFKVKSRGYVLGTRDIKKYTRGTVGYNATGDANLKITINTNNPDSTIISKDFAVSSEKNYERFNIRKRGYSVNVELEGNGEVEFNTLSIEGFVGAGRMAGTY